MSLDVNALLAQSRLQDSKRPTSVVEKAPSVKATETYADPNTEISKFFDSIGKPVSEIGTSGVTLTYILSFADIPDVNGSIQKGAFVLRMQLYTDGRWRLRDRQLEPLNLLYNSLPGKARGERSATNFRFTIEGNNIRPYGTMGSYARYTHISKADTNNGRSRAFVILGWTINREYITDPVFKGREVEENHRWANIIYYLISDEYGNIGWVTYERALHIGLNYSFANARIIHTSILPITPVRIRNESPTGAVVFPFLKYSGFDVAGFTFNAYENNLETNSTLYAAGMRTGYAMYTDNSTQTASEINQAYSSTRSFKVIKVEDSTGVNLDNLKSDDRIAVDSKYLGTLRALADIHTNPVMHNFLSLMRITKRADEVSKKSGVPVAQSTIQSILREESDRLQNIYKEALLWSSITKENLEFVDYCQKQIEDLKPNVDKNDPNSDKYGFDILAWKSIVDGLNTDENAKKHDYAIDMPAFEDMLSKIDPLTRALNIQVYSKFTPELRTVYTKLLCSEPVVTEILRQTIANVPNADFDGFEYRIKSPASLCEKVNERARAEGKSTEQAIKDLKDALRYTVILPGSPELDTYVEGTRTFVANTMVTMQLIKFKNAWRIPDDPYQGINTAFNYAKGAIAFEVQFHTKESYDAKNGEMHKQYEISRAIGSTYDERVAALIMQFDLASKLYVPNGVLQFDMSEFVDKYVPDADSQPDPIRNMSDYAKTHRTKTQQDRYKRYANAGKSTVTTLHNKAGVPIVDVAKKPEGFLAGALQEANTFATPALVNFKNLREKLEAQSGSTYALDTATPLSIDTSKIKPRKVGRPKKNGGTE